MKKDSLKTQKALRREVEAAAIRLAAVIEHIDEGITLSDTNGHFAIFNSNMGDITGYTMQEANSDDNFIGLICPDPDQRRKAMQRMDEVEKKGGVREVEMVIRAKDGMQKTLLVSTSLMYPREGKMFLSVYRDVSAHKMMDQLKDEFISTVSHELRTPLAIVKEGISLVLDEIPGKINSEQAKVLNSAKVNIDRLARIINRLLDMSKIEAGKIEVKKRVVNLIDIVKEVVRSFGPKIKEKSLSLKMSLPPYKGDIFADEDMVTQVITNLLDNAIKFTKSGTIQVSIKSAADNVECSVSDTGTGIARTDMPKLFGKFQQFSRAVGSGERGTGLGLSIAKSIINMHGGIIRVESELGKGTKVVFTLPKST